MVKPKAPSAGDLKKFVELAKWAVDDVLPFVHDEVIPAVSPVVDDAVEKAVNAKKIIGDKLQKRANEAEAKKLKKETKEAAETARKALITASIAQMDAKVFKKAFEDNIPEDGDLLNAYYKISGCYAIATYKSAKEKDLSKYKDIFVSGSPNIGFDVYHHLRGLGNPDVYADIKFEEHMKILIFPCDTEQLSEKIISCIDILHSAESYNKWDSL